MTETTCSFHTNNKKIPATEPRPEPTTVKSYCTHCPAEITVTLEWWRCMNDGCESKWWVQDTVDGVDNNARMCEPCLDRKMTTISKSRYYQQSCPPSDFDPSYCGERWDDDY